MVKYYTPKEVARELRVTERTVYGWLTSGRLRGLRAGTRWRVRPDDVEAFMKVRQEGVSLPIPAADAQEHAARVDALMGKYAYVSFSTEDLFRERQSEREPEGHR